MRILIVSPTLSGGGAEYCAVMWANGFSSKGHNVTMLSDVYSKITYFCTCNVTLLNLFPRHYYNIISKWFVAVLNIRRSIKQSRPDVIICVLAACSFAAKIASIGSGIPVIMTEHDAFERPQTSKFTIKEKLFKFYINKIYDCVTVITQRDKDVIGNRLSNVVVMPNPLSIEPLTERPNKERIILAAGRLDGWHVKGFDVLLSAWRRIANNAIGWKLEISGTGTDISESFLKKIIDNNGLGDSVELLGYVEDMASLYKKADIFVLSSRYEGFGLVLIEAMSQGCACVACDYMGRQKEIIGNEGNGMLCVPDNIDSLADSMIYLINNIELRNVLGENAIKRSNQFVLSEIIAKWEVLINDVVHNNYK